MNAAIVNERLAGKETSTIHTFERAGLGLAPFRFTGTVSEKVHCVPGGTPKAGSSCDYCGTGIRYEFWVESSDGKTFKVGCDCIHKTGDSGLIRQISVAERQLRDAKNKKAKAAKLAKENARLANALEILPSVQGTLADQPHPRGRMGETLLDYVRWMIANGFAKSIIGYIEQAAKS